PRAPVRRAPDDRPRHVPRAWHGDAPRRDDGLRTPRPGGAASPRRRPQRQRRREPVVRFSIVIATYNRAALLHDTLDSLARLRTAAPWEVIVVDNNSPDHTRSVIEAAAPAYPVPLRYAFEPEQGRSAALNRGFRLAAGEIVVTTDDDVRVNPDWLNTI